MRNYAQEHFKWEYSIEDYLFNNHWLCTDLLIKFKAGNNYKMSEGTVSEHNYSDNEYANQPNPKHNYISK